MYRIICNSLPEEEENYTKTYHISLRVFYTLVNEAMG